MFLWNFVLIAQNLSLNQLIKNWKTDDKTQTIKAEETYLDLKIYKNKKRFHSLIQQIKAYEKKNQDKRLYIRIKMYELLGKLELNLQKDEDNNVALLDLIKKGRLLGDQQLLSELYTFYAERGSIKNEDKLFYNSKAIDIQEKIGIEYFPKIHIRYYNVSHIYYNWRNYRESISYGKKALNLLNDFKNQLDYYVFQYDILAQDYYKLNEPDSGIYYYTKLKEVLEKHKSVYGYSNKNSFFESEWIKIWEGISNGGFAKGHILRKDFKKAIPLLESNIQSSSEFRQWDDVAKAQNLLGNIYLQTKHTDKAIDYWQKALKNCVSYISSHTKIEVTQNLSTAYLEKEKYDSAYFYNEKYHNLKNILFEEINQEKLAVVHSRLEHEKMQNTINKANTTINKQKTIRNLILVIVLLLFSVMTAIYIFKNKDHKRKEKIKDLEIQNSNQALTNAQDQLRQLKAKIKSENKIIQKFQNQEENQQLLKELKSGIILTKEDWQQYQKLFEEAYPQFIFNLKTNFSDLTQAEIRQLCLEKLHLSTYEIASTLGISQNSVMVTRHRIRKKLKLENQKELQKFVNKIS